PPAPVGASILYVPCRTRSIPNSVALAGAPTITPTLRIATCVSGFDMIPPPPPTPQPLRETAGAKTRSDPRPNGYRKCERYGVFVVVLLVVVFAGALRSTNEAISAATFVLSVAA